ncbi:uncharacterized protein LOC125179447 isoform X1 [Hyalella azteca]|uniref:Uncharacterized protein LOC125179447 isoform X1 n=1 Tax=Hyalella azteca TaxID=294128 RepID=A0A979FVK6_HYAAZ|nr:uncharacterized protein LOC125179447 isoform X1 [Hyalella azteca]
MQEFRILDIFTGLFTSALCFGLSMASYPDSVNVVSGSSGAHGCGGGRTTSVRFRSLQVRGPKSMVTYLRFSITESDLAFATNASKKITASDVVQCARTSALAVVDSYQLFYVFPREDDDHNAVTFFGLDIDSCVTDTLCGMPVLVNITHLTYYILNECGNTIQLPPQNSETFIAVFSHPGFGCKAFPDGPTYNCSVTFIAATLRDFYYYGSFFGTNGSCDGYTLGLERIYSGISENVNLCTDKWNGNIATATFILRGTAAAKMFKAGFTVFMP